MLPHARCQPLRVDDSDKVGCPGSSGPPVAVTPWPRGIEMPWELHSVGYASRSKIVRYLGWQAARLPEIVDLQG